MNRISPHGNANAPRLRPFRMSPRKPNGRINKSQVGGKEDGANPDYRSTTGKTGLNENLGTPVTPDQRHVTAPPDTSTSPLNKGVLEKGRSKPKITKTAGSSRPKKASAIVGYPVLIPKFI